MKIHRPIRILPVLLTVLLVGCLEMRQEIRLESDKTGKFFVHASVPVTVYENVVRGPLAGYAPWFEPTVGASRFENTGAFSIHQYRVFTRGDRQYLRIEGTITDLEKACASGLLGPLRFSKVDGHSTLSWEWDDPPDLPADEARSKAFAGLAMQVTVEAPSKILATSAPHRDDREVRWQFSADDDPDFLRSPPKMSLTWK